MIPRTEFGYAQARMQAGLGTGPDGRFWDRLIGIQDPQLALRAASSVAFWQELIRGLSAATEVHMLERAFRTFLRSTIRGVAAWVPSHWSAPVSHTSRLIELPVVQHLARGGRAYHWIDQDPVYSRLSASRPEAGLVDATLTTWRQVWWEAMPAMASSVEGRLRRLEKGFLACLQHPCSLSQPRLPDDLRLMFRRHSGTPLAPFIWLSIIALELWRLRGALIDRFLFREGNGS